MSSPVSSSALPPSSSSRPLRSHRAVVTGASSGIGEQYARQLAALGADLVLVARRADRLARLAEEIRTTTGVEVSTLSADLSCPGAARTVFDETRKSGRTVTILINNAGIGPFAPFLDVGVEKHLETIQLNAVALTELSHLFTAEMRKLQTPCYVSNVASIAAYQAAPNFAVYAATKHFVRIFSEVLRHELRATKVKVSCLCPGGTSTEFSEKNGQAIQETGQAAMMSAEEVARQGIAGMLRGEPVVIPGVLNKLACLLPRFLSNRLSIALAEKVMSRAVKSTWNAPH